MTEKVDFLALKEDIVLQDLHIAKNHGSPKSRRLLQIRDIAQNKNRKNYVCLNLVTS